MRVFVYYNLHRKLWSVKALEGENKGRVIAHERSVLLADATGKVSQAGRERVLREKRKNVHAGIVGELIATGPKASLGVAETIHGERAIWNKITYNPYRYSSFVFTTSEVPYHGSRRVFLGVDREVFAQVA